MDTEQPVRMGADLSGSTLFASVFYLVLFLFGLFFKAKSSDNLNLM